MRAHVYDTNLRLARKCGLGRVPLRWHVLVRLQLRLQVHLHLRLHLRLQLRLHVLHLRLHLCLHLRLHLSLLSLELCSHQRQVFGPTSRLDRLAFRHLQITQVQRLYYINITEALQKQYIGIT